MTSSGSAIDDRCESCGVKLDWLAAYSSLGDDGSGFAGLFCVDCALKLVTDLVCLAGMYGYGYGVDYLRYDVRCRCCGGVGEWECREVPLNAVLDGGFWPVVDGG